MKRQNDIPAFFAMVTVAFLFALAPVFHAVCVSAMSHGSNFYMSHVMADGTVMNMDTEMASDVMNMDASHSTAVAIDMSHLAPDAAEVMGAIMITAGLTMLTFFALRFCKHVLARTHISTNLNSALQTISHRRLARARPPSRVDLNSLCISRT